MLIDILERAKAFPRPKTFDRATIEKWLPRTDTAIETGSVDAYTEELDRELARMQETSE